MSNVHDVHIEGFMSHDALTIDDGEDFRAECRDRKVMDWLATLNLPVYGIRISYPGDELHLPNKYGGETTFCRFIITGQEAIWKNDLVDLVKSFCWIGTVYFAQAEDLEGIKGIYHIPIPGPYGPTSTALVTNVGLWLAQRNQNMRETLQTWTARRRTK